MRELGLFGTTIPEEYGGLGLGLDTYALIVIELSRGWMSLSGILNGHFIAATMIRLHGTDEQRERYLPRLASGELRSSFSMTEPHAGSDVQSIRTRRRPRRRRLRHHRPEDVGHERLALGARHAARQDRPRRRPAAPGDDGVPRREGARVTSPPASTIPMPGLEQARLQGRRVDRARLRRLPHARGERARRRGGHRPRVQVLHERDRGRARQRRRARRRPRAGARSTTRSATRRSARRSASRSPVTRPCS